MKYSIQQLLDITALKPIPNHKKISKGGYVYLSIPNHPQATKGGYYLEHRFVIEKKLGRFLSKTEVVHHKNKVTNDNRIENLEVYSTSGQHIKHNHTIKDIFGRFTKNGKIVFNIKRGKNAVCICGKTIYVLPSRTTKYCSQKCMGKIYSIKRKGKPGHKMSKETKIKMSKIALLHKRNPLTGRFF